MQLYEFFENHFPEENTMHTECGQSCQLPSKRTQIEHRAPNSGSPMSLHLPATVHLYQPDPQKTLIIPMLSPGLLMPSLKGREQRVTSRNSQ